MVFSDQVRAAAGPSPFPQKDGTSLASFKRKIPKGHPFDPRSLKPMAKMLWAMSISLGHALTAYRQFNRVKSATISPDGMLGGHGYVMSVGDVRRRLYEACEALSAISDTIHDEIHAPHWRSRLLELDPNTAEDVERFVEESIKILESPEDEAEEEMSRIERSNDAKWKARGVIPEKDEPSSGLPVDGPPGQGWDQVFHGGWGEQQKESRRRTANSSEPVNNLPGPRVDHIGPAEGGGPFGSYNDEPGNEEAWRQDAGGHAELGWRGSAVAESALPLDLETRTDADDFGLGYGRRGDGAEGYGVTSPDGKGFWGPASGLPDDPGGLVQDPAGGVVAPMAWQSAGPGRDVWAALPNDGQSPVARTDDYPGSKGNTVSQSEMPGDESVTYDYDRDLPNAGQVFERTDNPYVKWDSTIKDYRPDTTYQRRLREG